MQVTPIVRRSILASLVMVFGLSTTALAQATQPAGALTGTWRWTTEGFGGQQETVLKLKQEGDKLTGTITGFGGEESAISEAKFAGGTLTFKVVRDFGGQSITTMYTATVTGGTIKGKSETVFPQQFEGKKAPN